MNPGADDQDCCDRSFVRNAKEAIAVTFPMTAAPAIKMFAMLLCFVMSIICKQVFRTRASGNSA